MKNILQSNEGAGVLAVGTVMLQVGNHLEILNVNNYLTAAVSIFTLVWIMIKTRNEFTIMMDNRKKRKKDAK